MKKILMATIISGYLLSGNAFAFFDCKSKNRDESLFSASLGVGASSLLMRFQGTFSLNVPIMNCTSIQFNSQGGHYSSMLSGDYSPGENILSFKLKQFIIKYFYLTAGIGRRVYDSGITYGEGQFPKPLKFYTWGPIYGIGFHHSLSIPLQFGVLIAEEYRPLKVYKRDKVNYEQIDKWHIRGGEENPSIFFLIMEVGFKI